MIAFEFGQLIIRTALQELGLYYDEKMHCEEDGMEYFVDSVGASMYLPKGDDHPVFIGFSEETQPGMAAEFAMRFSRILEKSGIKVVAELHLP